MPALELNANLFSGDCFSGQGLTPVYDYSQSPAGDVILNRLTTCSKESPPPTSTTPTSACGIEQTVFEKIGTDPAFQDPAHEIDTCSTSSTRSDAARHVLDECYPSNVTSFLLQRDNKNLQALRHGAVTVDIQPSPRFTGAGYGIKNMPPFSSQLKQQQQEHQQQGRSLLTVPEASGRGTRSDLSQLRGNASLKGMYVRAWFDTLGPHSLPAYVNVVNNGVLKTLAGDTKLHIETRNHPLNTSADSQLLDFINSGTDASVAVFVIFALSFIPASVLVFLVRERVSRCKFMQLSTGCAPWQYWLACFLWDMSCYLCATGLCVMVFASFGVDGYSGRNLGAVSALLVLYGVSCTSLMYPFSFAFRVPSSAYVTMVVVNLFIGMTTTLATFVLDRFPWNRALTNTNQTLKKLFLLFPNYCFGRGLLNIATNEYSTQYYGVEAQLYGNEPPPFTNPFVWEIAGEVMLIMAMQALGFFLLTLAIEHRLLQRALQGLLPAARSRLGSIWRWRASGYQRLESSAPHGGGIALVQRRGGEGGDVDVDVDVDGGTGEGTDSGSCPQTETVGQNAHEQPRHNESGECREPVTAGEAGVGDDAELQAEVLAMQRDAAAFAVRVEHLTKRYEPRHGGFKRLLGQLGWLRVCGGTNGCGSDAAPAAAREAPRAAAVDNVSFGVRHGECFGLLGVNGAGKTTTFKVISGEHRASAGDVFLDGHCVRGGVRGRERRVGYCPQEDALLPLLTCAEHMHLFGELRGMAAAAVDESTHVLFDVLGLQAWADTRASQLSGGTKRKLSLGIALLGTRSAVLLDEPSAGMDAHAKRFLWSRVLAVVRSGRSVLLTSHSMEECEALCTRLTIMVDGKLKCIGSPQHLKSKHGDGYTLVLKARGNLPVSEGNVRAHFPGAHAVESHRGYARFFVPTAAAQPLSRAFARALALQREHGLEHFSIGQTTLEDVFCKFAQVEAA